MATVAVGIGSNVGDRHRHMRDAGAFLEELAENGSLRTSSIYITEPVGPSTRNFFNAAAILSTSLEPAPFIRELKRYEQEHGRAADAPRWSPRTIDLDIIAYNDLVIQEDNLIIPHPEYSKRLFVLFPLRELEPGWRDPRTNQPIGEMIEEAPPLIIHKTGLSW